jgi:hypothetical protein
MVEFDSLIARAKHIEVDSLSRSRYCTLQQVHRSTLCISFKIHTHRGSGFIVILKMSNVLQLSGKKLCP